MTASLFVIGTTVPTLGDHRWDDERYAAVPGVAHAVAKPAVDGLDSSVCGLLVTACAAEDWPAVRDAPRCEECSRIVG